MMKDKLIDLITIGIARYHIKKANGENVDMAAIIADVLIENDYRKSTDVAEEIFAEIGEILHHFGILVEQDNSDYGELMELILGDIIASIAELKKKYTEELK